MIKSLLFPVLILTTVNTWAAGPQITGASGVSNLTLPTTTGTTVSGSTVIYGGLAGECTSASNLSTCDSCTSAAMTATLCGDAANGLCACNKARIFGALSMTIAVKRADTTTGPIRIAIGTNNTVVGSGSGDSVSVTWDEVCNKADSGGNCDTFLNNKTISAKIFIDKNNDNTYNSNDESGVATDFSFKILNPGGRDVATDAYNVFGNPTTEGIGAFKPYPGDAKIYLEDLDTATNFPTLGYGSKAVGLRVFHASTGLAGATAESADSTDLKFSTDGNNLERNVVSTGLNNGTTYIFRIAMLDEANNVVQFFPAAGADAACDDPAQFTACAYAATPDQVLGLLKNDFNCFIATAAYGSFLEPKLQTFRDFKFKILLQNKYGRRFVESYYKYGPYAARYIYNKPTLRALTRAALWPLYVYSAWTLRFGIWPVTTLAFSILLMISSALYFAARRGFARG